MHYEPAGTRHQMASGLPGPVPSDCGCNELSAAWL